MVQYVKATNFYTKDALLTGNPSKIIKGAEIDDEYNAIATAISSKADTTSPTFTGTPIAPTAAPNTNTTQIATTAFVTAATGTLGTMATQNANAVAITGGTISGISTSSITTGSFTTVNIGAGWSVVQSGTDLIFKYSGTNKMKVDSSGNLTVVGNITAYGTV
jgi:hypothetical protein